MYRGAKTESERLHEVIESFLEPASRILDIGCGGGKKYALDYRGARRQVVGLDVDQALWDNQNLDDRVFGSAEHLPFASETFDLTYTRYVFEHLPQPAVVLCEISRVLKRDGVLIILTPNVYHYVTLIARLTPASFHRAFNARIRGRREEDTFPTLYRANTTATLRRLAADAGLREVRADLIETRPNYLAWSLPSFLLGVAYERLVNSTEILRQFRVNILGVYQKV